MLFAGRYDLFRDELYFIVCGQHPALGYADQPPLVPLMAAGLYQVGHSALWVRLPAVLAAGLLPLLTIRLIRLLGGGRLALWIGAVAVCAAPLLVGLTGVLNTTAFEPLAWTALTMLLVRGIRDADDRALLIAGLVAGITLEAKYALLLWAAGLAVGILVTPQRRLLLRPAFWGAAALAGAIAAPSLIWQALHGFPFVELSRAAAVKNADIPIGAFLLNQFAIMNPALAPVWLAGLVAPFVSPRLRNLRFIAIAWLVHLVLVRFGHGKDYYLAASYPSLFAIGAVALAPLVRTRPRKVVLGAFGLAAAGAIALAGPLVLPLLPPERLAAYLSATGMAPQAQEKSFKGTALPQIYADQLGWHDFAAQVDAAWAKIPSTDRAMTAINADNYGEAAALDLYTDLPPALSGHNQYYLWGLRGQRPANLLFITDADEDLRGICTTVERLGTTQSQWAMAYENGKQITLCRGIAPAFAAQLPGPKSMQ